MLGLIALIYLGSVFSICLAASDESKPTFETSPLGDNITPNVTAPSSTMPEFNATAPHAYEPLQSSAGLNTNATPVNESCPSCSAQNLVGNVNFNHTTLQSNEVEHAFMNMTAEQKRQVAEEYSKLPQAYLNPENKAKLESGEPTVSPTKYSVLNYLWYIPRDNNQASCGNCWVWPGHLMMSIDLANKFGIKDRLSVQFFNSEYNGGGCTGSFACCGGSATTFAGFYTPSWAPVPWSGVNAQFRDGSRYCGSCSASTSCPNCKSTTTQDSNTLQMAPYYDHTAQVTSSTIPTIGVGQTNAINNIKNVLMQNQGVYLAWWLPDSTWRTNFNSFWNNQDENVAFNFDPINGLPYTTTGVGHATTIVGWDETDPSNKYWIVLNSWGDNSHRPNGLYAVKMDMNYDNKDSTGSSNLLLYSMNFNWANPETPAKPTGLSPPGTLPTLKWNKVHDATWYGLWIDGPSGNVLQHWYKAEEVTSETNPICTATPDVTLAPNTDYTWYVIAWNQQGGYSVWSDSQKYRIGAIPNAATLINPSGTSQHTKTPGFVWNREQSSTWYRLWINDPSGAKVLDQWYTASEVTTGSICAVSPQITLPTGSCTWWVQTWNDAGTGPWSNGMTFSVP